MNVVLLTDWIAWVFKRKITKGNSSSFRRDMEVLDRKSKASRDTTEDLELEDRGKHAQMIQNSEKMEVMILFKAVFRKQPIVRSHFPSAIFMDTDRSAHHVFLQQNDIKTIHVNIGGLHGFKGRAGNGECDETATPQGMKQDSRRQVYDLSAKENWHRRSRMR